VGRYRVAKIMRDTGWGANAAKKYKAPTNSNHSFLVAPNLLVQNFEVDSPDKNGCLISPLSGQMKAG
jgi:hypothetical protein